jgi:hypothetical protein
MWGLPFTYGIAVVRYKTNLRKNKKPSHAGTAVDARLSFYDGMGSQEPGRPGPAIAITNTVAFIWSSRYQPASAQRELRRVSPQN